jgi:hypothetical protein
LQRTGAELAVCAKKIALAKEIDVLLGEHLHELVLDLGSVTSLPAIALAATSSGNGKPMLE